MDIESQQSELDITRSKLTALQEITRIITSTLDIDSMLVEILKSLSTLFKFEFSTLSLVDEDTRTISTKHGIWAGKIDKYPEWIRLAKYPLDRRDIQTDIIQKGQSEIIDTWDDRFNKEIWDKYDHQQYIRIFVPIKIKGKAIGLIESGYKKVEKSTIDSNEAGLLETFASDAAIALENAAQIEYRKEAEKNALLHNIANHLAHRFKNAAGSIPSAAREARRTLLEGGFDSSNPYIQRTIEALEMIEEDAMDLMKTAESLNLPYKLSSATGKSADVKEALNTALIKAKPRNDIDVVKNLAKDLPTVKIDFEDLKDIFYNVIKNSLEAMDNKAGELTIDAKLSSTANSVLVTIADNGSGIPYAIQEKLFKAIQSTKAEKGMGVFLYNAREILRALGGNIELVESDDRGTKFRMSLPI